jgi:integrase
MKINNPNHPKKGDTIKVEPITELKDIKLIKKLLKDKPRDYCLFTMGINTNLRASGLTRITAGDVRGKKPGDDLTVKEQKTGKARRITLNDNVILAVTRLLAHASHQDTDPLFKSQKGNKALSVPSVNRLVKGWCREINLKGNYGSHTLRKTFGYMQRTQLNTSVAELIVIFNHSSQKQTLDYLCIQPEEIKNAYMQLRL